MMRSLSAQIAEVPIQSITKTRAYCPAGQGASMNKQREHRRTWTEKEDEVLKQYVQESLAAGKPKWKQICERVNADLSFELARNPKQCRERWHNLLAPVEETRKNWTLQDDIELIKACKEYGHRWSKLILHFSKAVNDNRLKNHFYSCVRKTVRTIGTVIKEVKKQYQQMKKAGDFGCYSQDQVDKIKNVAKIKRFESKLLSKVFSLIDSKQQFKYEARQSLSVEEMRQLNHQVLDYMQDCIAETNQFTLFRTVDMISRIMYINKIIQTKYVREVKLTLKNKEDCKKDHEFRKKIEKKINSIVKSELNNMIIPDRKTRAEIIQKIKTDRVQFKKLFKPIKKPQKRLKRKKETPAQELPAGSQPDLQVSSQEICSLDKQKKQIKNQKLISPSEFLGYEQIFVGQNPAPDLDNHQKSFLNSQEPSKQTTLKTQEKKVAPNYNHIIQNNSGLLFKQSIMNSIEFAIRDNKDRNQGLFHGQKNMFTKSGFREDVSSPYFTALGQSKNKKSTSESIRLQKAFSRQKDGPLHLQKGEDKNRTEQDGEKANPFVSNFLNNIPLMVPPQKQNKLQGQLGMLFSKQHLNPFFPEHKLTNSQGYFSFEAPVHVPDNHNPHVQKQSSMYKSNPILPPNLFVQPSSRLDVSENRSQKSNQFLSSPFVPFMAPPVNNFRNSFFGGESQEEKLRHSQGFEGLFASYGLENNDKASQNDSRLRSGLFELPLNAGHPNQVVFHPFELQIKAMENEARRESIKLLQVSRPFSANNNQTFGNRINMLESQPMNFFMYRSSEINPESHPSANLYHSYSYGHLSGENKSRSSRHRK